MDDLIADWPRTHFKPGGGDAVLFYAVFGKVEPAARIARSQYRTEGLVEPLQATVYGPAAHPEVVRSFRKGFLWNELQRADSQLAATVAVQQHCLLLRGTFPDPPTLNYLRDAIGVVTHALDHGAVAVYDPQMFTWWSPSHWREKIFDPGAPMPGHHCAILVSRDEGGEWVHTRGLRQFGRPDLSARGVMPQHKAAVIDVFNRLIEFQAMGGLIAEGQEVRMPSLPSGWRCHHRGQLNDPDFNNVHVAIE